MKQESMTAVTVADNERDTFLVELFGKRHFLAGDTLLYSLGRELAEDHFVGGFWLYRRVSNGALYAAPEKPERMTITSFGSQSEFDVSADAAGIILTLYAIGRLMERITSDEELELLDQRYYALLDYAKTLPESTAIRNAIS